MTLSIEWWWAYQSQIETQFGFSRIREDVASRIASRIKTKDVAIGEIIKGRDWTIVGAGIDSDTKLDGLNLIVADGALRACLQRDIVPEIIVTDLDGYMPDLLQASEKGSNVIVHLHGDNLAPSYHYSKFIVPSCLTSTYPSEFTECWGGFTDGDRSLMMVLFLECSSVELVGFDFTRVGAYSGLYSPRKMEKLVWAERIIKECLKRSSLASWR